MPHDPEKYLYDICQATKLINQFVENKSFSDYVSDLLLQSGVERQLIIAGEALNKLSKVSPDIVPRISSCKKVIAFRNLAVHGYDMLDNETIWGIVKTHVPVLLRDVEILLKEIDK